MIAPRRIRAAWRIRPGLTRSARVGDRTLYVSNYRVAADGPWRRDSWGPVRWLVADDARGTIASGHVYQGTDYSALVRQAMLDAELAAETVR